MYGTTRSGLAFANLGTQHALAPHFCPLHPRPQKMEKKEKKKKTEKKRSFFLFFLFSEKLAEFVERR